MPRLSRTNFPKHSVPFRRTAALAACAALTLSGCGTVGHDDIPVQIADGAYGQAGGIRLRNVFVLGPAPGQTIPRGGPVAVFAGIVNNGAAPDRLTRVAAPGFAQKADIAGGGLDVPVHELVGTGPAPPITLTRLAAPLSGTPTVRLTLTFENAGPVTLGVPVMTDQGPFTTFSPSPAASPRTP